MQMRHRGELSSALGNTFDADVVRMRRRSTRQVRSRISYMDNSQLEKFLQAAKAHGPREHAMFLFAVAYGARASEICNLRISDLNLKSEQVHIARLKGSLDSTQTLLRVKGSALFNESAALKAWLDVRKLDADGSCSTRRSLRG
jgi:integrase